MSSQNTTLQNNINTEYQVRRALAYELGKRSPFFLGRDILGYKKFAGSQVKWDLWTRKYIDLTGKTPGKFLVLQPRETFKTTYFTISLSMCLLLNNPELSILIANERESNVYDILKEIKHHFEGNETFRAIYGDWVGKSWAGGSITVNRKKQNHKEPSVWVTGIGAAITSKHPDVIICDDIAGKKDKESDAGREQTLSFFQDIWDLLKKDTGLFIMEGTRKHVFDIYQHVRDTINPQLKEKGLEPFIVLETPAHNDKGELNFPDVLSEEKLNELRIVKEGKDGIDYATFMAEYELNPLDPKTQVFKQFHYIDIEGLKFDRLSQWTDPAMAEKKDSDYSAIAVVGQIAEGEHKGKRVLLYGSIDKRSPTKVIQDHNRIYRMIAAQNPDIEFLVNMEQNGFVGLKEFAQEKSLTDGGEPVPTRGRANTENKDIRIQSLEPAVTQGMLLFRSDWMTAPENYKLFTEQFRNYPQAKKDGPDAVQGAMHYIKSRGTQVR